MQQGFKNSEDSQETSEERLKRINEAIETIREKYSTSHNNNEKIQNEVEKTKQENKIKEIKIEQEKESKKSLKPFIFIGLVIVISLISIIVYKNNFVVKKEYSKNGNVIGEGKYYFGKKDGTWIEYYDGKIEEVSYNNGIKNGISKIKYDNGNMEEFSYVNNVKNGAAKFTYINGDVEEYTYNNDGIKQGAAR